MLRLLKWCDLLFINPKWMRTSLNNCTLVHTSISLLWPQTFLIINPLHFTSVCPRPVQQFTSPILCVWVPVTAGPVIQSENVGVGLLEQHHSHIHPQLSHTKISGTGNSHPFFIRRDNARRHVKTSWFMCCSITCVTSQGLPCSVNTVLAPCGS